MVVDTLDKPQWVTYKSVEVSHGAIALSKIGNRNQTTDSKLVCTFTPIQKVTEGIIKVLEHGKEFHYEVDTRYGTLTFSRKIDVEHGSGTSRFATASHEETMGHRQWRAASGLTFGLHEVGQLRINADLYRLIRPDAFSPNLVLYHVHNAAQYSYIVDGRSNQSVAARILFGQPFSRRSRATHRIQIEALNDSPSFLPTFLSFVIHSFVLEQVWKNGLGSRGLDTDIAIAKVF